MNFNSLLNKSRIIILAIILTFIFITWMVLNNLPTSAIYIDLGNNQTAFIDGKNLASGKNRVQPGEYTVIISGPYTEQKQEIKTTAFKTTNISTYNNLSMESIAHKALEEYGRPAGYVDQCKDYNGELIICRFSRGSPWPIALKYKNSTWTLDYFGQNIDNKEAQGYYNNIKSKVSSR